MLMSMSTLVMLVMKEICWLFLKIYRISMVTIELKELICPFIVNESFISHTAPTIVSGFFTD